MIVIRDIRMSVGYNEDDIVRSIKKNLKNCKYKSWKLLKESLDSRKKNDIHYVVTIGVELSDPRGEQHLLNVVNNKNVMLTNPSKYTFPHIINTDIREFMDIAEEFRPVIVGSGPAGYHAAIKLAKAGFKPIVLERGNAVEERIKDVETIWTEGKLREESNVCFGEGGAGTFSDGKLNTGNKDKGGYFKEVLDTFVLYGAREEITYKAKPHIGTDELRKILINMRRDIEKYGGEVRFGHKLMDIECETSIDTFGYESNLPIYELTISQNPLESETSAEESVYKIKTHAIILAIGHSARDTYKMLMNRFFEMEPKAFAVGMRVEHKRDTINKAMYGDDYINRYGGKLPTADYKLVYHSENKVKRNVFSFCMCPGGYVVNSSTEKDGIVINGMSYSGRNGNNSNSAIVVNVDPSDFGNDICAGIDFQRKLEQKAYIAGKGNIPVQLYKDFKKGKKSEAAGEVQPDIKGKWSFSDLREVFPEYIIEAVLEAMPYFGKKINGFDNGDTIMSAVESRTSSPLRIIRDSDMMALNFPGIIPAGEGAGYAGGITSASADGIKSAEALSSYLIEDLIECYKAYETSRYL